MTSRLALAACAAAWLCACAAPPAGAPDVMAGPAFAHDIEGPALPWTHERFDSPDRRVTFALFSDLTGGERDGVFDEAVERINLLAPELVLNVGDLIEGETTDMAVLDAQWDDFDARAGRMAAPVFRVGGNHDLSHPVSWSAWEQRYGPRHYHFVYRDLLFLVLDTEDNTAERQLELDAIREHSMVRIREEGWGIFDETPYGQLGDREYGTIGAQQADEMIAAIEAHPDVRWTFVVMHKPAWKRPDEQAFTRIEAALQGRDYTVFNGHEHFYELNRRHGRDYIQLGTTGGFQPAGQATAIDHVTLVTIVGRHVNIANLRLDGIFDREGPNAVEPQ